MNSNDLMPIAGSVINHLINAGNPDLLQKVSYDDLLAEIPNTINETNRRWLLDSLLSIIVILGLIREDTGNYEPISRNAYFALASLARFFNTGEPIVGQPIISEEAEYLVDFTRALEKIRCSRENAESNPIHQRRIVNILIKSRQNRGGRKQDVYLHFYHAEWQAYHLIGLGQKRESETDKDLIKKAMEIQLGLSSRRYRIDETFYPSEIRLRALSATSGAYTEYRYQLYRIQEFTNKLSLKEMIDKEQREAKANNRKIRFNHNSFRWFTLDEIYKGRSVYNERIMFSSPKIFTEHNLETMSINAPKADDIRPPIDLASELGNRISYKNIIYAFIGIVIGILMVFYSTEIMTLLGTNSVFFDNTVKLLGLLCSGISAISALLRLRS